MDERRVRGLRHRNLQLKQKVWDQYRAYSEELSAMKRQNRALEQSLKVEQKRNAEMFEHFAKKIREMERKVKELRNTSPFGEIPAVAVEPREVKNTSFLFMELEEEGKMIDAKTDAVFKRCHEPIATEYAWRSPPPVDYDNEYRPAFLVTPELASKKVLGYQDNLSESISLSSEEDEDEDNTLVQAPKVKLQTNDVIKKPLYAREMPSALPEPQTYNAFTPESYLSDSDKDTLPVVVPKPKEEPVVPKSGSGPSYSSQTIPESVFSPAKENSEPNPVAAEKPAPKPVARQEPKLVVFKQAPQDLEDPEEEREELFGLGGWGSDDDDSDERPEIDSETMRELNLGHPNEPDVTTMSQNPSETMPLKAESTITQPSPAALKSDSDSGFEDIPDLNATPPEPVKKQDSPKVEITPPSSPPKGILPQESSSKLDDMEIEFEGLGDVDLGPEMW